MGIHQSDPEFPPREYGRIVSQRFTSNNFFAVVTWDKIPARAKSFSIDVGQGNNHSSAWKCRMATSSEPAAAMILAFVGLNFATHGETTAFPMPLWPYLTVLALVLYIGDVFLRRVRLFQ
jgi:hypothetical protein